MTFNSETFNTNVFSSFALRCIKVGPQIVFYRIQSGIEVILECLPGSFTLKT